MCARARMYVCVELAHKHTDTHTNEHTHMARRRGNRIKDYKRKINFTHHKTLHCLDFYAHVSLQLIYYILKRELKINVISRTQTHSYAWQDLRKNRIRTSANQTCTTSGRFLFSRPSPARPNRSKTPSLLYKHEPFLTPQCHPQL